MIIKLFPNQLDPIYILPRTGLKRVMDGALSMIGPEGEGRMIVKYSALPIPYDTEYVVLGTDYDNYAVLWSCSGIGPVHTRKSMF